MNPYLMFHVPVFWNISKNWHYCWLQTVHLLQSNLSLCCVSTRKPRCLLCHLIRAAAPEPGRAGCCCANPAALPPLIGPAGLRPWPGWLRLQGTCTLQQRHGRPGHHPWQALRTLQKCCINTASLGTQSYSWLQVEFTPFFFSCLFTVWQGVSRLNVYL